MRNNDFIETASNKASSISIGVAHVVAILHRVLAKSSVGEVDIICAISAACNGGTDAISVETVCGKDAIGVYACVVIIVVTFFAATTRGDCDC